MEQHKNFLRSLSGVPSGVPPAVHVCFFLSFLWKFLSKFLRELWYSGNSFQNFCRGPAELPTEYAPGVFGNSFRCLFKTLFGVPPQVPSKDLFEPALEVPPGIPFRISQTLPSSRKISPWYLFKVLPAVFS